MQQRLKELKFEKSNDELIYQLANDKDIIGRNWALGELTKAAKNKSTSDADKEKVMTAIRNAVEKDAAYEIRLAGLNSIASVYIPTTPAGALPQVSLNNETIQTLLKAAKDGKSNVRFNAISALGITRDPKFADFYFSALNDRSYSVIDQAAIALGNTKNVKAYDALIKLANTPSWKGRIAAAGFKGLGALEDKRGLDLSFKTVADKNQPANVQTAALSVIASAGKGDSRAFPLIFESFKASLDANDFNGVFGSLQSIIKIADPRGQQAFDLLKAKFKDNQQIMGFANFLESQFKTAIQK